MTPDVNDPFQAPASDPSADVGPAVAGFLAVAVFHGAVFAGASLGGFDFWASAFGVLQLLFLMPLVALMIWRGAPRGAVVGVFIGAALAFALNVALIALSELGASLV